MTPALNFTGGLLGVLGVGDVRLGEDALGEVHLPVGAPVEGVEQLVAVFEAKAGEEDFLDVGLVVAVGVLHVPEVGGCADVDAAAVDLDGGGEVEAIGEDGDLVGAAVVVGVFEDLDAVAVLGAFLGGVRIVEKLDDPEAAAVVPGHGDGVDDVGLGGEEANFKPLGDAEMFDGLIGVKVRRGGGIVRPGEGGGGEEHREGEGQLAHHEASWFGAKTRMQDRGWRVAKEHPCHLRSAIFHHCFQTTLATR